MTPERWQQIEALCFAALDHPPSARAAFLDEACAGDADLRREVESLLAAFDADPDFMETPLLVRPSDPQPTEEDASARERIGPYACLRRLGRGGMGQVYLAVREDAAYRQEVAIKVIRRGMDTEDLLRRFRTERQILAALRHPNIAHLYDGGITEDGRPYLVMEYVDGLPIPDYCDRHRLSIAQRIALFQQVCAAVHYAHQNLIVHRDLKPGNILVTADGVPKLLDFGIAKLLNPDQWGYSVPRTQADLRLMTPEYASPEQVRGHPITTASDLYALGVLLYELLAGHRPYDLPNRLLHEVERIICEEDPPKPSTAVSTVTEVHRADGSSQTITPEQISDARQTHADRLQRQLRGDLDNIVLKAMRKEPERRYASAAQLAEDLQRHLSGLPVQARPATLHYRAAKFVQRHRWGVAAGSALVLLLVAFSLVTTLQADRIQRQAEENALERAKAEQVAAFLMDLFEMSDPAEAKGATITARELLERGVANVERTLSGQPAVQAQMMSVMGNVYRKLTLHEEAEPLARRALALRQDLYDTDHAEVAASLVQLAQVRFDRGAYAAADSLYAAALAMQRRVLGTEHPDVATTLEGIARSQHEQGNYAAAESLFTETLVLHRRLLGPNHEKVAMTLFNLGWIRHDAGDYTAAESLYTESLAMQRQQLGEVHPDVASTLSNLGWVLHDQGRYDDAEPVIREALALRKRLFGEVHQAVAQSLNNLARLKRAQGQYDDARALYRQALDQYRTLLGSEHAYVAITLSNLANTVAAQGDAAEAEAYYREALAVQRQALGNEHQFVAATLNNLGALLQNTGAYAEAEAALREALAIDRAVFGDTHPYVATDLTNLGGVVSAQGDYTTAETYHREALAIRRQVLDDTHDLVALSLSNLAGTLRDQGRLEPADSLFRDALARFQTALPEDHPRLAEVQVGLGRTLTLAGRPADAEPLLRAAFAIRHDAFGSDHWRTAEAQVALGLCLSSLQRYDEARPLLVGGHAVLDARFGNTHPLTQMARDGLAQLH